MVASSSSSIYSTAHSSGVGVTSSAASTAPSTGASTATTDESSSRDDGDGYEYEYSDDDSALGSDISSELTTLNSSITNYVYKNGRRYAGFREGQYRLPNDELECDRNDLLYHIYGMLFGGELVFAPIGRDPQKILDVGTGTGIWAIDVADLYPNAEVTGTDLSPIQPQWVPPNLQFIVDDAESDWAFDNNTFDLIHMQNLNGSIRDWPRLLSQIYDHLRPGGHFESKEASVAASSDHATIPASSSLRQWEAHCAAACAALGQTLEAPAHLPAQLRAAGFVDVRERVFKLPVGAWPREREQKQLGRYQLLQYLDALEPFALGFLVDGLGWSRDQMEVFLVGLRHELRDRSWRLYNPVHVITARKPLPGEVVG